jgi:hypothetical protein
MQIFFPLLSEHIVSTVVHNIVPYFSIKTAVYFVFVVFL